MCEIKKQRLEIILFLEREIVACCWLSGRNIHVLLVAYLDTPTFSFLYKCLLLPQATHIFVITISAFPLA